MIPRILLSLGLGLAIFAVLFFILAFTRATSELNENITLLATSIAIAIWAGLVLLLWTGRRHSLATILTVGGLLTVWLVTIALCFFWSKVNVEGEALFITGTLLAGAGISIGIILLSARTRSGMMPDVQRSRAASVRCPSCSYSMNGLHECTCPECGARFTIDELLAAQR